MSQPIKLGELRALVAYYEGHTQCADINMVRLKGILFAASPGSQPCSVRPKLNAIEWEARALPPPNEPIGATLTAYSKQLILSEGLGDE